MYKQKLNNIKYQQLYKNNNRGFTIVELIIVIVVIAILATLSIVAYNGISSQAGKAVLKENMSSFAKQLEIYKVTNDKYPPDTSSIKKDDNTTLQYTYTSSTNSYCLTATNNFAEYYISNDNTIPQEGICSGHFSGGIPVGYVSPGVYAWGYGDGSDISQSMGGDSVCALSSGDAYCWGYGYNGILGNGNTTNRVYPDNVDKTGVLSGLLIDKIVSGNGFNCAIANGSAYCWGWGNYGKLGNGGVSYSTVPVAVNTSGVLSGKTVTDITAGRDFACVVASGKAYCWGRNTGVSSYADGALGNGDTADSSVPVAVTDSGVLSGKTVTQITAGEDHACALADGSIYCWGLSNWGQAGDGYDGSGNIYLNPVATTMSGVLSGKTVTQISAGGNHTCAIADGQLYCWGSNSNGVIGNNSGVNALTPVAVDNSGVLSGKTILSTSGSSSSRCVVASDNKAYCWGDNFYGKLGNGNNTSSSVPVAVDTSGVLSGLSISAIGTGQEHTCALAEGNVYCWGRGSAGTLGDYSTSNSNVPVLTSHP